VVPGFLEKRTIKRLREKFRHVVAFHFSLKIRQDNLRVPAKFPDNLAARAAGRGKSIGVGHDGDGKLHLRRQGLGDIFILLFLLAFGSDYGHIAFIIRGLLFFLCGKLDADEVEKDYG
jgi:hypothetical protein